MLYDCHMHTPLCRHAIGEPEQYAQTAIDRGLAGIVFTCHNPMTLTWSPQYRMRPAEFVTYQRAVHRVRNALHGRLDVLLGMECDYAPGFEEALRRQLAGAPFDFVLGSIHPQFEEYQARYWKGDVLKFQKTYFTHLAQAAESKLFDALGHADLIKNITARWDLKAVLPHLRKCLDRIAASGTAMELNTSGLGKDMPEFMPGPAILKEMASRGIPVVLGSDAHSPDRVAFAFEQALDTLAGAGFKHVSYYVQRKPRTVEIAAARLTLRPATLSA